MVILLYYTEIYCRFAALYSKKWVHSFNDNNEWWYKYIFGDFLSFLLSFFFLFFSPADFFFLFHLSNFLVFHSSLSLVSLYFLFHFFFISFCLSKTRFFYSFIYLYSIISFLHSSLFYYFLPFFLSNTPNKQSHPHACKRCEATALKSRLRQIRK